MFYTMTRIIFNIEFYKSTEKGSLAVVDNRSNTLRQFRRLITISTFLLIPLLEIYFEKYLFNRYSSFSVTLFIHQAVLSKCYLHWG